MKFYNIFLKESKDKKIEDLVLIKEGFNIFALIFNVLWLMSKKCFFSSIIFLFLIFTAKSFLNIYGFMAIYILLSLLISFEGHRLLIKDYIWSDYKYLGYTSGNNEKEAKRRFLDYCNKDIEENDFKNKNNNKDNKIMEK